VHVAKRWSSDRTHALRLIYFAIAPSAAWSFVYGSVKIVADVLLIFAAILLAPRKLSWLILLAWTVVCAFALLIEWNIFPDAYGFYLYSLLKILGTTQGLTTIAAITLMAAFVASGPSFGQRFPRHRVALACVAFYAVIAFAKLWPPTKPTMIDVRIPALRALQVISSDGSRAFAANAASAEADGTANRIVIEEFLSTHVVERAPSRVLFVVLESWGEAPNALSEFVRQIEQISSRVLTSGYREFRGSTLPGELRELCGATPSLSKITEDLGDCLPARLARAGYVATAYHGYEGFFYMRDIVYPRLGFESSYFLSELRFLQQCDGAFAGVCDDVLVDYAIDAMFREERAFTYVLSLSAHEPASRSALGRPYAQRISIDDALIMPTVLNRALIAHAIREVRERSRPGESTWIYFAGDHNPPSQLEGTTLPRGKVPYLLVEVRLRAESAEPRAN
jgi:hypothetical protein